MVGGQVAEADFREGPSRNGMEGIRTFRDTSLEPAESNVRPQSDEANRRATRHFSTRDPALDTMQCPQCGPCLAKHK